MIDHVTFGVSDFGRSTAFYDKAFAPLGVSRIFTVPPEFADGINITGYGDTRPGSGLQKMMRRAASCISA